VTTRASRLGPTAVLGLAGAGLAAVSSAQGWARAEATVPAVRVVEARGSDVAPVALPLALVALAAWGAVLVLRRRGRRVVSAVGLLAALGVAAAVVVRLDDAAGTARQLVTGGAGRADVTADVTTWPYLAVTGAALAALAFVVALRAAPGWPEMSSRYDAPAGDPAADPGAGPAARSGSGSGVTPSELWKAMDEGRDPTA
jgi:uncharacterized membrane protein (TIGR02234 family)